VDARAEDLPSKSGVTMVVEVEGFGQDFSDYTRDCLDRGGVLSGLDEGFRAGWGWGFQRSDRSVAGILSPTASSSIPVRDDRQVARPGDADSVAEAMRLRRYRKLNEVPFFAMLGDKRGPR